MRAPEPVGLVASLRRLLGTLLETAQVRLDLIAVEIEQEKQRLLMVLLMAVLALLLACVGLVLAAALLVLAVAPPYRLAVLALLVLVFLGAAAALVGRARAVLATPGGIAAASRGEIARDRQALEDGR
jgi:uncharacterized membrane protein YqjE